jgi:hypothetical protein
MHVPLTTKLTYSALSDNLISVPTTEMALRMAPLLKTEWGLVTMLRSRVETHHTLNDARRLYGAENGKSRKNLETTVAGAVQWSFVFLPLLCIACERTKTFCVLKTSSCTCVGVRVTGETADVETLCQ